MASNLQELELGQLLALAARGVKRRWKWALSGLIVLNVLAAFGLAAMPRSFRAECILEPGVRAVEPNGQYLFIDTPAGLVEKILSRPLKDRATADLKISESQRRGLAFRAEILGDPTQWRGGPGWSVSIVCESPDPFLAVAMLSSLLKGLDASLRPSLESSLQGLSDPIRQKKTECEKAREEFDRYASENDQRLAWHVQQMARLESRREELLQDIERLKTRLGPPRAEAPADPASSAAGGVQSELSRLESQRAEAESLIRESQKIVKEIEDERDDRLRKRAEACEAELARLEALQTLIQPFQTIKPPSVLPPRLWENRLVAGAAFFVLSIFAALAAAGAWEIACEGRRLLVPEESCRP